MFLNFLLDQYFIIIFFYFLVYNTSLIIFVWLILSFLYSSSTYNFNLLSLSTNIYFKTLISIILISLAGIPPFLGFFTKIFIINFIINSSTFNNFIYLFIIIVLFLYFYIQNLKIIFSNNYKNINYSYINYFIKLNYSFFFVSSLFIFFLSFSIFFIDDLLLVINFLVI